MIACFSRHVHCCLRLHEKISEGVEDHPTFYFYFFTFLNSIYKCWKLFFTFMAIWLIIFMLLNQIMTLKAIFQYVHPFHFGFAHKHSKIATSLC